MHIIATTRFNTKTWDENQHWRNKHEWEGCVYGTPTKTSDRLTPHAPLFILEMHNDENKVKGIGLVKNAIVINQYHYIYSDRNYNRYTYKSKYRIDRNQLSDEEEKVMAMFDVLLFKGARHMKRGQGITSIPDWMANNRHVDFKKCFKDMFMKRFRQTAAADEDDSE